MVTDRTVVRLAARADCRAVLSYYQRNRQRLEPVSPKWPSDFLTKNFWERQIDSNLEEFYADSQVRLFVFPREADDHTCIGHVSLSGILRNAAQFCYMGYGISTEVEGQGLMREAVAAVIDYAFIELNLHRIMANYMPSNDRSGQLLRGLGFVVEGIARNYLYLNGQWQDHVLTSLTNPNWQPVDKN